MFSPFSFLFTVLREVEDGGQSQGTDSRVDGSRVGLTALTPTDERDEETEQTGTPGPK